MSKYDGLDARKQLEQEIAKDLKRALEKRGFEVKHNGTNDSHAPAFKSDIEVFNQQIHINVEVTKSAKSSQDREWQSIKDHFEETQRNNSSKKCFVWFVSPETYYRTINSIKDWNFAHKDVQDQKMLPICFSTLELFMTKLIQNDREIYNEGQILNLFENFVQFVDDENVLRQFYERLFSSDSKLKDEIEKKEEERHQRVVEELISEFKQLEQRLRDSHIATTGIAIKTVIYLVFIKLYEEKKEKDDGERNRFTLTSFAEYQKNERDRKTAVHKLFNSIKEDPELKRCKLFTEEDILTPKLKDAFVIENFIKPFEEYTFYTTKVDGLGAAYEVLGQLSGKDVKVGQFFTPENVVKFMVKLAELEPSDSVFDPACGTARFLTNAMDDMILKAKGMRNEKQLVDDIQKKQLFGTDDDPSVAKLAKMNMYIQGDGKTNIKDEDGLTRYERDNQIDVILTNPPLGDTSYDRSDYDDTFKKKRMEVIPKKNITEEKLSKVLRQILEVEAKLSSLRAYPKKEAKAQGRLHELKQKKSDYEYEIKHDKCEIKITGKKMKGGALFLNACKYYLKDNRDTSAKPEWRGGKVLTIIDEGVLNTDNYSSVRGFIKKYFFIKAVISLTKDTFIPVSKTATKTSILYLIKKDDIEVVQHEPIFFAHAEKVGLNTKKKVCENHLFNQHGKDITSKFFEFKKAVLSSYDGNLFDEDKFIKLFKAGELND